MDDGQLRDEERVRRRTDLDERRIMMKHWLVALAALAMLPLALAAQSPEERIQQAMTRAGEVGIPVSLLESKMAEGRAKGVPMDRIATAIEARFQALERAREVMGRGAEDLDAAQISVGADALVAGVSEEVLQEIAATSGGERRAVAVAALTQLVLQGVVPQEALHRVQAALARGPAALANLPVRAGAGGGFIPDGAGPPPGTPGAAQGGPPGSVPAPGRGVPPTIPPRGKPPGKPPGGPPGGGGL